MKKRRRVEITAFRRRTTIVLRDRLGNGPIALPLCHVDSSHSDPVEASRTEEVDLDLSRTVHDAIARQLLREATLRPESLSEHSASSESDGMVTSDR